MTAENATGWTSFRGDPQLTGVARGTLPTEPKVLWTFEAAEGFAATAAISGGAVYVGALGGTFHALSLADGSELWSYRTDTEIRSSALVADATVYFGDEGGTLHAVDAESGEARWTFTADGPITSSPNYAADAGAGCILFGSYDNHLYCVRPDSGELAWKLETASYVHGTPAVAGETAIVSGCDGLLRRVRLRDGTELAAVELGGYAAASPAVSGGRAYLGTFENQVVAVDLDAGELAWRWAPERELPFYASPAVAPASGERPPLVIAPGRDKLVHALDAGSGEEVWSWQGRARLDASPVVVGDRVLVADLSGRLAALALADGAETWTFTAGTGFDASPAVGEGRLVIGDADGLLYCFG